MTHLIKTGSTGNIVPTQADKLRTLIINSAVMLTLALSANAWTTQISFADVRDVNRTAGETVDTVMWPTTPAKKAPKSDTSKDSETSKGSDSKPLRCGVVLTILVCF